MVSLRLFNHTHFSGHGISSTVESLGEWLRFSGRLDSGTADYSSIIQDTYSKHSLFKASYPHASEMTPSFRQHFFEQADDVALIKYFLEHPHTTDQITPHLHTRLKSWYATIEQERHTSKQQTKAAPAQPHQDVALFWVALSQFSTYFPDGQQFTPRGLLEFMYRTMQLPPEWIDHPPEVTSEANYRNKTLLARFLPNATSPLLQRLEATSLKSAFHVQPTSKKRHVL
jgi:hypothetical protein